MMTMQKHFAPFRYDLFKKLKCDADTNEIISPEQMKMDRNSNRDNIVLRLAEWRGTRQAKEEHERAKRKAKAEVKSNQLVKPKRQKVVAVDRSIAGMTVICNGGCDYVSVMSS